MVPPTSQRPGYVLILPGIMNVKVHLAWFAHLIRRTHPLYEVEIRRWGIPLGWITNLRAHARNHAKAKDIAEALTLRRQRHPESPIHIVGYSGGGGLAVLAVRALPEGVSIDRLLLIAAAVSPRYPLTEEILPKVSELMVNYASRHDWQIAYGTRLFGNMDGTKEPGAGAVGFAAEHEKLLQVHWHRGMRHDLHFGSHISYLSPSWQRRYLLPALDPDRGRAALRDLFARLDVHGKTEH